MSDSAPVYPKPDLEAWKKAAAKQAPDGDPCTERSPP